MNELFKQLSHGVYVIAVSDGLHHNAFTAAWVMQVSFDPPLLAISINPEHYSYSLLQAGGVCTVNVLGQGQSDIAAHFGRSDIKDKMAGFNWEQGLSTAPVLTDSLAYFDCQVSHYTDAGDHKIVVCNVIAGAVLNQGSPLLYNQTGDMDSSDKLYRE
ncbi:MAG: flavin reductase family protein [Methylococcaceae bacterium]|nr:flavin reductase family protein [Methylococcaceae bacterium]MDD1610697.1 flavin reductase family protein [Methylococcaceae bacterium]MDD1616784.1 flavin reductase family protein [Methylococcaceae bacterium]OYV16866.1 MAG: Flavin reductase domain protein FMN-binding [Methylococcaceae bacterium NSP1-2]